MEEGIVMNTTLDPNKQGGGMLGKLFAGRQARALRRHLLHHDLPEQRARPAARRLLVALPRQDQAGGSAGVGRRRSSRRRIPSSARRRARTWTSRSRSASAPASSAAKGSSSSASAATAWRCSTRRARSGRRRSPPGETLRVDTGCIVAMEQQRPVRHPARAGHQDGAVRRRGIVLRHAHRSGTRDAADDAVLASRRSDHRRRAASNT